MAGERWVKHQDLLDRGMAAITDALLPFAGAKQGERVLDVGCGCGTTSLKLAQSVGTQGAVTSIDISEVMLGLARSRAKTAGANIDFIEADASDATFSPECDLLFSRFGVMFFADPVAAFTNLYKALKPDGRLAFVCWRGLGENIWARVPIETAKPFLPPQQAPDPLAPGPFAFADAGRIKTILARAGFSDIRIEKLDTVMWLGTDVEEATTQALSIGPLARAMAEVDAPTRDKIRAALKIRLKDFIGEGGIAPAAACWLVGAQA